MSIEESSFEQLLLQTTELLALRRFDDASNMARAALVSAEAAGAGSSETLLRPLELLGRAIGQHISQASQESIQVAKRARDLATMHYGLDDLRTAQVLHNCSLSLRGAGMLDASVEFGQQALEIADRNEGSDLALWLLRILSTTLLTANRYSEALELCARLYEREIAASGISSLTMIATYQLGQCLLRLGHKARAVGYLERALDLHLRRHPSANGLEIRNLLREAQGQPPDGT